MDALINVNGENFQTLQILLLTTLITLLPSIVVMMTSFTRYIISLSFLRSAIGLQQNPAQHGAGGNGTVPHPVYHVPGDQ